MTIQLSRSMSRRLPAPQPSDIKLTLIFDGTTVTNTYDMPSGAAAGDTYLLAIQTPSEITASGEYAWNINEEIDYTGTIGAEYESVSGLASVVNRDSSPYGAGWGIAGVDQLLTVGTTGVLWMTGTGG